MKAKVIRMHTARVVRTTKRSAVVIALAAAVTNPAADAIALDDAADDIERARLSAMHDMAMEYTWDPYDGSLA